jgi:hypothetical protein
MKCCSPDMKCLFGIFFGDIPQRLTVIQKLKPITASHEENRCPVDDDVAAARSGVIELLRHS